MKTHLFRLFNAALFVVAVVSFICAITFSDESLFQFTHIHRMVFAVLAVVCGVGCYLTAHAHKR